MNLVSGIVIGTAIAVFSVGIWGLVSRTSLIKMVMGIEFLGKGVSLLFIFGGFAGGDTGVSQAVVFTLIVIEAVVAAMALALVIVLWRTWGTLDNGVITLHLKAGGSR